ncbi:DUF55-domain-containing protein [Sporormia fimetaria CBS 119925]|uniref:Thymocyte nuclear protein 1 n=1 Tax=Sporormia fimetaria CBS 119925 TaxID=1340428 RepID=A0A6A6V1H2_9PLEO|nr:DUF55-domain-containing protein [Sporormia fimetaria CBS 119925]
MVATRRSTRQSDASAPQYAESSSEHEDQKPTKTRQKRMRPHADEPETRPRKQATKSKPDSLPKANAPKPETAPPGTNRDAGGNQVTYWLFKAEPLPRYENGINVAFSIDDLKACTKPEPWSGVRNFQARNTMQEMREGDLGFFYHSNAKPSGIAGILRVVKEAEVDETAFDPKDPYYDAKSDRERPKWYCVSVEFVEKFDNIVELQELKSHAAKGGRLQNMQLVTHSRLSVSKLSKEEWEFILELAKRRGA